MRRVRCAARLLQGVWLWLAFRRHFSHFAGVYGRSIGRASANCSSTASTTCLQHRGDAAPPGAVDCDWPYVPNSFRRVLHRCPRNLIQAVIALVHRLGLVTTARTAALVAHRQRDAIVRLGIYSNRYSLVVFMPAAIFLAVYGDAVFHLWLTPEFAAQSAPLLVFWWRHCWPMPVSSIQARCSTVWRSTSYSRGSSWQKAS